MDSSVPPTSLHPGPRRIFTPAALVAAVFFLAYAFFAYDRVSPFVGGSDSSGYYNNARMFAQGRLSAPQRTLPELPAASIPPDYPLFMPLGLLQRSGDHTLVPGYPIGLSMLTVAVAQFTRWEDAPGWLAGIHLLAGVFIFFLLARAFGLSRGWSAFGTAILALSPLYLAMGLQPMSDNPSLVWCAAAVLFALYAQKRPAWALAAGAAFALAVLIRPTNILMLLPLAVAFATRCSVDHSPSSPAATPPAPALRPSSLIAQLSTSLRSAFPAAFLFILGGLPGAAIQLAYNHLVYGHLITTGYGNMSGAFELKWLGPTLVHYAHWLPLLFSPAIALALLLPFQCRRHPGRTALLAAWFLPFLALYSVYFCTHDAWWYLRFLLPAAPALIIAALLVARDFTARRGWPLFTTPARPRALAASALAFAALAAFNHHHATQVNALGGKLDDRSYYKTSEWLNKNAPPESAVIAMQSSGSIFAYTPFVVIRWDAIDAKIATLMTGRLSVTRRPLFAVLYPFEQEDAFKRLPGPWREVYQFRSAKIWRFDYDPPAK